MKLRQRGYLMEDVYEDKNISYVQAKAIRDQLYIDHDVAEAKLKDVSGSSGSLGLVPDYIKASKEWQKAYKVERIAFVALRNHNVMMTKLFKREMAVERGLMRKSHIRKYIGK